MSSDLVRKYATITTSKVSVYSSANFQTQIICRVLRNGLLFTLITTALHRKPRHCSPWVLPLAGLWRTPEEISLLFLTKSQFVPRLRTPHLCFGGPAQYVWNIKKKKKKCWHVSKKISGMTLQWICNMKEASEATEEFFEVEYSRNGRSNRQRWMHQWVILMQR